MAWYRLVCVCWIRCIPLFNNHKILMPDSVFSLLHSRFLECHTTLPKETLLAGERCVISQKNGSEGDYSVFSLGLIRSCNNVCRIPNFIYSHKTRYLSTFSRHIHAIVCRSAPNLYKLHQTRLHRACPEVEHLMG